MSVEEEHFDVLQNMEFEIVQVYRSTSDLIDAEVLNAIESLIHIFDTPQPEGMRILRSATRLAHAGLHQRK
jgi:hypothetical protein